MEDEDMLLDKEEEEEEEEDKEEDKEDQDWSRRGI